MSRHTRWAVALPLIVLLGAIPIQAAAQDAELPHKGSVTVGQRFGFGQISLAEPAGTFPIGFDGEFYLNDFISAGAEILFLTANAQDNGKTFNLINYWDVFVKLHLRMPETGIPMLEKVQPYFRWGVGIAFVDFEDRDGVLVDFAMPFAFGAEYWIADFGSWGLGAQMEFATYLTGISSDTRRLPNNSVVIPWLWTVGIRVKFG